MKCPGIRGVCAIAPFGGKIAANRNCRELVLADSPEPNFLLARVRIEAPSPILLDDRNRERPVLGSNVERRRSIALTAHTVHLLVFLDEHCAVGLILAVVMRRGEIRRSTQDVVYGRLVV